MNSKGQTLLEIVIVVAVIVIIVASLVFAIIFSIRNAQFSKNQAQATKLAQEGLERVRAGRDRNVCINGLASVNSWDGNSIDVSCAGSNSMWAYTVAGNCGNSGASPASYCAFKVDDKGVLNHIQAFFVPSSALVPNSAETVGIFKRAVFIDDSAPDRKTVIVVVTWSDFAGHHQSRLTTFLRKI